MVVLLRFFMKLAVKHLSCTVDIAQKTPQIRVAGKSRLFADRVFRAGYKPAHVDETILFEYPVPPHLNVNRRRVGCCSLKTGSL